MGKGIALSPTSESFDCAIAEWTCLQMQEAITPVASFLGLRVWDWLGVEEMG
jgi:hypothetical protein